MNLITDEGKHYLYRHIRLDKNEVFYIGIGTKKSKLSTTASFERAYSIRNRNKYWKNITNKTEYRVEILLESNDYEFVKQKEIEFIALYGRKDLKKGTLVNMTDGGDGGNKKGNKSIPVYMYGKDGLFIKKFTSMRNAALYLNVPESSVGQNIKGSRRSVKQHFFTLTFNKCIDIPPKQKPHTLQRIFNKKKLAYKYKKPVNMITKDNICICCFFSVTEASKEMKINCGSISKAARGIFPSAGGYLWTLIDKRIKHES